MPPRINDIIKALVLPDGGVGAARGVGPYVDPRIVVNPFEMAARTPETFAGQPERGGGRMPPVYTERHSMVLDPTFDVQMLAPTWNWNWDALVNEPESYATDIDFMRLLRPSRGR